MGTNPLWFHSQLHDETVWLIPKHFFRIGPLIVVEIVLEIVFPKKNVLGESVAKICFFF